MLKRLLIPCRNQAANIIVTYSYIQFRNKNHIVINKISFAEMKRCARLLWWEVVDQQLNQVFIKGINQIIAPVEEVKWEEIAYLVEILLNLLLRLKGIVLSELEDSFADCAFYCTRLRLRSSLGSKKNSEQHLRKGFYQSQVLIYNNVIFIKIFNLTLAFEKVFIFTYQLIRQSSPAN